MPDQRAADRIDIRADQADGVHAFADLNMGRGGRCGHHGMQDCLTGKIAADAGDAGQTMRRFAVEQEGAVRIVVEGRAQCTQALNGRLAQSGQGAGGNRIDNAGSGGQSSRRASTAKA